MKLVHILASGVLVQTIHILRDDRIERVLAHARERFGASIIGNAGFRADSSARQRDDISDTQQLRERIDLARGRKRRGLRFVMTHA